MSRLSRRITDADLRDEVDVFVHAARDITKELAKHTKYSATRVMDYALLAVVVGTPFDRVLVYLKDCKTPESARARLLLRAAEHTFREIGDQNGPSYG